MNHFNLKISFLFVITLSAFVSGCEQTKPAPAGDREVFYYAEKEKNDRQFDTSNGVPTAGVSPVDISKTPFNLGRVLFEDTKIKRSVEKTLLPEQLPSFYIDGNHAIAISGKHRINDLEVADSMLTITGSVKAHSVIVGMSLFRSLTANHKSIDAKKPASLVIDGPGHNDSSHFRQLALWGESFLDVKTTLQVGDHDKTSALIVDGLIVAGLENDLAWRMQGAELDISNSTVRASKIAVTGHARLKLRASHLITTKKVTNVMLDLTDRSVTLLTGKNTLLGLFNSTKNSYLLINEGSNNDGIKMGSLSIDGMAIVGGKIAVNHSFWSPGDESDSLAKYQQFFKTDNEFILIKAKKLIGRASLLSQEQARKELKDNSGWIGYFEKHVVSSGKKLALQHDYTNNVILLKIVDKLEPLDDDGCLKDIGKS